MLHAGAGTYVAGVRRRAKVVFRGRGRFGIRCRRVGPAFVGHMLLLLRKGCRREVHTGTAEYLVLSSMG